MLDSFADRIEKAAKERDGWFTIQSITEIVGGTWPTVRFHLLRLVEKGKLEVQELQPRGLIFCVKKGPVAAN